MKKSNPLNYPLSSKSDMDSGIDNTQAFEDGMDKFRREVDKLSYEESLNQLDSILSQFQNDNISLEKIQSTYTKGSIYLSHCENLLKIVEQEVEQLNLEDTSND